MKPIYFDGAKAIPISGLNKDIWTEIFGYDADDFPISVSSSYQVVAWIYRATHLRANAVSSIPYVIMDQAGNPVEDVPFADKLPELLHLTESSLSIFGAAYWFKSFNLTNRLLDLRWMIADSIDPVITAHDGLVGFKRRFGNTAMVLEPEEVVYFWLPDPLMELGPGRSPASVVLEAAGLAKNINTFAAGFFKRGAIYPTILTVEGNPPKAELEKLETWWKRLVGGAKSAWETVALRANVNVETLSQNIEDMAMPELTDSVRKQIAVAFGIPQTMLEDAANFATAKEHRISFWRDTIVPEATLIQGVLNHQLFEPFDLRFDFVFEEIEALQQDEAEKTEAMVRLVEFGIISATEARQMLNIVDRAAQNKEPPALPAPDEPAMIEDNEEARSLDLRRWRTVALKEWKAGNDPASRTFNSDTLTADEQLEIVHRLQHADSREEVRAAFEPPFFRAGAWAEYP